MGGLPHAVPENQGRFFFPTREEAPPGRGTVPVRIMVQQHNPFFCERRDVSAPRRRRLAVGPGVGVPIVAVYCAL